MRATAPLRRPPRPTPPPASDAERESVRPRRPSYRRALAVGLLLSAVAHIIVFVLAWRTRVQVVPATAEPAPVVVVRGGERREMRVERIVPVPDAAPAADEPDRREREEEPEPEPRPRQDRRDAEGVDAVDPWADVPAVERLRPRMGDPRLWTRPEPPPVAEPSDIERVRSRIAGRIGEWNDSISAEAARAAGATDWTVDDGKGGKWGISPGKLHLGGVTLPLPVNLSPAPWQREEAADRARKDGEIADQEAREGARENFKERVEAIRERKERERQEKNKKNGSGSGGGDPDSP